MTTYVEMSHPEHAAEEADMLQGIANTIRAWQERQTPRLSDEQLLRRYPALGSTKTYRRLREGDMDGLVPANHVPKYQGVLSQIEDAEALAAAGEEVMEDIRPAMETTLAIAGLVQQRGLTRLVIVEGPTGAGKTMALGLAAGRYPGSSCLVEAHEGWASLTCALGDMLVAAGAAASRESLPAGKADRLAMLVGHLKARRMTLMIDEGQHMTAAVLNAVKTLINLTDSAFVITAIGTLWEKLTCRSWEEAKQLLLNRTFERVRLAPPGTADVRRFLARRCGLPATGAWAAGAARVAELAAHYGWWAFVRRVADRLAASASGETTAADVAQAAEAVASGIGKPGQR